MIAMKKFFNHKRFKYGGYATAMIIFVVAAILLVNVFVSAMDDRFNLKLDLTQNRMFTIGQQTETILGKLDRDIYFYTLYSEGNSNEAVDELLKKYSLKSEHVKIANIDPVKQPAAVAHYQREGYTIQQGNIIVTDAADTTMDGQRFKVLDQYDLYQFDMQTRQASAFKGEKAFTSAIMYIQNEDLPKIWFLDGHNKDTSVWAALRSYFEDENYEVANLSLVTEPEKLQKGDILISLAPEVDLSAEEREVMKEFMLNGGKLFLAFDTVSGYSLPNFESLLKLYDIKIKQGMIIEGDNQHYAMQGPQYTVPIMQDHDITKVIKEQNKVMLMPATGALDLPGVVTDSSVEIKPLLTTTDKAFIEPNTMEVDGKPDENAEYGPFTTTVAVTKQDYNDETNNVQMVITTCPLAILGISQMPTFANLEFFVNSVAWMSPAEDDIYIRGKSLASPQLFFKSWGQVIVVIGIVCLVIPVAIFVAGIVIFLRRRHL